MSEVAPNLHLRELINITEDVTENISQLENSITKLHTKRLTKDIKRQLQQNKNRFDQNVCIIKTLLKRLTVLLNQWKSLDFDKDERLNKNVEHELAYVYLEEKMRMSIAYEMFNYINYEHDFITKAEQIKAYARHIVKVLQEPLSLEEAPVLTAIEMSNRANLSSIKLTNSTAQKLNTTYNLCRSVKTNIVEIRRRINRVLVAQYL